MATVKARKATTLVGKGRPGPVRPLLRAVTLSDLITAVQDVVGPQDDRLVVATVRHLLRSGWVTRRGTDIGQDRPLRLRRK
jgi:hypothetical protein